MGGGCVHAEKTGLVDESPALCPDILVRNYCGLPVILETEFEPALTVEKDACSRLGLSLKEDGVEIEQTIALRAPLSLRKISNLKHSIETAKFGLAVFSGKRDKPVRWPQKGWLEVGVDELATAIELAGMSENRLLKGMETLVKGVEQAASILMNDGKRAPKMLTGISKTLCQEESKQTWRMAMAIIVNALTFHKALEGSPGFETISQLKEDGKINPSKLADAWEYIYKNINYLPIFKTATALLKTIKSSTARAILDKLIDVAENLDLLGATSQNSLNGRMFQRLITDRKFLATFYTLPNSAAFLAELAVSRLELSDSSKAVTDLRIADFACGTGALLSAAYNATMSRCRRKGLDDRELHPHMMQHVLAGTDIMPAASHLSVSMLASSHPNMPFEETLIATLSYGEQKQSPGVPIKLGALDLINENKARSIFDLGNKRILGIDREEAEDIEFPHGSFDLVIMNPPFTRPTGHSSQSIGVPVPSFAAFKTSKEEQIAMSSRLRELTDPEMAGHGNAGLASYFIDLAHAKVKLGGVIALVLPVAFVKGKAWEKARNLLDAHYKDITIISITSSSAKDCAFSADTGMVEALVIATRKTDKSEPEKATFISLARRPQHILEAVVAASAIGSIPANREAGKIYLGNDIAVGRYSRKRISEGGSAVLASDVEAAGTALYNGLLKLPRLPATELQMTKLEELGERGPYHADINGKTQSGGFRGPFDVVDIEGAPTYPMLWSHAAKKETRLIVRPDKMGEIREGCEGHAMELWGKYATRLHFNRDFSLGSQPLSACLTLETTLGGTAWPSFRCDDLNWEVPLVLWSNTTLGLISFWWKSTRQHPGRARLSISQLPSLAVLDPRELSPRQFGEAQAIFDKFKGKELLPAYKACIDQTRKDLDKAVLIELLGQSKDILEHLDKLRQQWCAEPSVHGTYKPASAQN